MHLGNVTSSLVVSLLVDLLLSVLEFAGLLHDISLNLLELELETLFEVV